MSIFANRLVHLLTAIKHLFLGIISLNVSSGLKNPTRLYHARSNLRFFFAFGAHKIPAFTFACFILPFNHLATHLNRHDEVGHLQSAKGGEDRGAGGCIELKLDFSGVEGF